MKVHIFDVTCGWSRRPTDPNHMCGECSCKWAYGERMPRWCRACRHVRKHLSDRCRAQDHNDCCWPCATCTCDCHGR